VPPSQKELNVWEEVSRDIYNSELFDGNFEDWLLYNLNDTTKVAGNIPSFLIFSLTLWFLWKWRCSKVFDINFVAPQSPYLIINQYAKDWWSANYSDSTEVPALFLFLGLRLKKIG
jgi:hypothetical protein